jgi:hypothetical protein
MGTLTSDEYDVEEGREWCAYLDRVTKECRRLIAEGRVPESEGLDGFLADSEVVLQQVRIDVASAASRGEKTITTSVRLTSEEYKRLLSMNESILNLLQILEMRGAVALDRSDAVGRVARAIIGGQFA